MGGGGTEKNQRSDEGLLVPVKKGIGEVGVSKTETEVGVKIARPCGRRRGEMPIREWERERSGKK
jgi:hypothetical protein